MEQGGNFERQQRAQILDFEPLFESKFDELVTFFEQYSDGDQAFIDPAYEAAHPDLRKFTDQFTEGITQPDYGEAVKHATYRAFHMAITVTHYVTDVAPQLGFERFYGRTGIALSGDEIAHYAQTHPSIVGLLDRFGRLLDPSGRNKAAVDALALATFMMLEDGQNATALNDDVAAFGLELEQWDGNLRDLDL